MMISDEADLKTEQSDGDLSGENVLYINKSYVISENEPEIDVSDTIHHRRISVTNISVNVDDQDDSNGIYPDHFKQSTQNIEQPSERILSTLWNCGPWQIIIFNYLSFLFMMQSCWPMISHGFIAAPINFTCHIPHNMTERYIYNSTPQFGGKACEIYDKEKSQKLNYCPHGYDFKPEADFMQTSIVSQWSLVCDQYLKAPGVHTIFMVGVLIGGCTLPTVSDFVGRRPVHITCHLLSILNGLIMAWMPQLNQYSVFQLLAGILREGIIVTGIVWTLEFIPTRFRPVCGIGFELYWTFHWCIFTLLAFAIRDWRWLQTTLSILPIISVSLIFFAPESPSWLLARRKYEKLQHVLSRYANRVNKTPFPIEILDEIRSSQPAPSTISPCGETTAAKSSRPPPKKYTFKNLFRSKRLTAWSAVLAFLWFQNVIGYYGLTFLATFQAGNKYSNFLLNGLAEVPAYFIGMIILYRVGRRWPLFAHEMLAGFSLLASVLVAGKHYVAEVLLNLLAKYALTFCFGTIVIYTPEIYPTTMRSAGLGLTSAVGRLAGLVVPYTEVVYKKYPWLPATGFGILGIVAGILAFFVLPETFGRPMPESISDIEAWPNTLPCKLKRFRLFEEDVNSESSVPNNKQDNGVSTERNVTDC